ncbi:MAG: DUF1320 domain-containing protein [Rhodocyclaceae bacterium]|nr:DUF1320 domain-containing protein [Gammaproteobacteria bacterium]MCB1886358.1 DUF1320 domain-containing protein [Rhodocyclaceae bacterium]
MAYCTQQDLIDRYGEAELIQLTDRAGADAIDTTALARAIADVDALVDGYLDARYSVPLSPVPGLIVRLACMLTRAELYRDQVLEDSHPVVRDKAEATRVLMALSRGDVSLGLPEGGTPEPDSAGPSVSTNTPDRVFDSTSLDGF